MEPWTFRDGLVWLAEVSIGADARTVLVDMGVFFGPVTWNYSSQHDHDAIDERNLCGIPRGGLSVDRLSAEALLAYAGLEAVEDFRGRRLKGSTCRFKNSVSPGRGSGNYDLTPGSQGHRQHGGNRWGRRDGNRADQHGTWRGERVQRAELEDTAASPNKSGSRLSAVANFIRRQHDGEERNRQLREAAWEAGLIFGHGDSREGTFSHNSASNTVSSSTWHRDNPAYGLGHIQDAEAVGEGLDLNVTVDKQVLVVGGGDSVGEQVVGNIGLERPWSLTQNSDPFNLGPLIDGAQRSGEGRAKRKGTLSKGQEEAKQCRHGKRQRYGNSSVCFGVSNTSGEGIGGPLTVSSLKEQVRLHAPDIVVLLETKNKVYRYGWLKKQLGMNFMHVVEPRGLSGGLCMFWKDAQQVFLVKYAGFLIEVEVHDALLNYSWRFFAVHASTDVGVRRNQWGVLQECINACREGCLVMGDFNDIMRRRIAGARVLYKAWMISVVLLRLVICWTWDMRGVRSHGGIDEMIGVSREDLTEGLVHWKQQEWRNSKICIDRLRTELQTELQVREYDDNKVRRLEVDLKRRSKWGLRILSRNELIDYWGLRIQVGFGMRRQLILEGLQNHIFRISSLLITRWVLMPFWSVLGQLLLLRTICL
ncbi:unnamed protein product [Prunus armeniaca]|uniref:Endonuclease/exonuclease/phosphatase domain-containing protein n=1 Tax=Prunus armeniaca TaxID=36596 RepID=A0A6J5XJW1_PRUAR|nr:unnamed protein product [Prunus armeniaca]